jgi:hypothetical protein
MNIVRTLFTGIKNDKPRWRDVCIRFSNLLVLCLQAPEVVNVLRENWGVASKTLFFSANWFFASSNQCKKIPFKFYENMLLQSPLPGRAGEPASSPYQMTFEARNSTMLFALRTSFLICRFLHRAKLVCPSKEVTTDVDVRKIASALLLFPEDLRFPEEKVIWKSDFFRTSAKSYADLIESFHVSVYIWFLRWVRAKVRAEIECNTGPKSRTLILTEPLTCSDCLDRVCVA